MSGRRSFQRFGVNNTDGYLRVIRDVAIWRGVGSEFVVISDEPEASGELLALEYVVNGSAISLQVCVIDGHPAVVDGKVRHHLRLRLQDATCGERAH